MRLVLRVGAFIIGGIAATLIVGILDDTFPWAWLPLLMGIAVTVAVSLQPWFRASRLSFLFCAALTCGTEFTFCGSSTPVTTRFGGLFPNLLLFLLLTSFLVLTAMFGIRGLTPKKTNKMTWWLFIPIIAGCVLGLVSGGVGGANHMVGWATNFLHLSQETAEAIVHYFRKSIHVSAYGIVGISLFRAAISGQATKARSIGFAMMVVFCMASFDELRQTTAPNRTGSAWDVALDMTGGITFVSIAAFKTRGPRPIQKAKSLKHGQNGTK